MVLFQPENEYTWCAGAGAKQNGSYCLDRDYMAFVEKQFRDTGIVVPIVSNEAAPLGNFAWNGEGCGGYIHF